MDDAAAPDGKVSVAGARYSIRAVERALDILDLMSARAGPASLVEVSRGIGLPKSSAFRYLTSLELRGYVVRGPGEVYHLATESRLMRPQDVARLTAAARPRMDELCRRFEETINLGTLDGARVAYLNVIESPRAMRFAASPGGSDAIHSSALGKAIAVHLGSAQVLRILAAEGMPAMTPRTITDPQLFLDEVAAVRQRRYAVDDAENQPGGRCVAVALPHPWAAAALSLSAPAARLTLEMTVEVAAILARAADDIARVMRKDG